MIVPQAQNPKVSLIVPVYNAEKYLKQCLESICRQTLPDIEIICVNDGSTDASLSILHEFAQLDKRIHVLSQENKGAGGARNLGFSIAQGEYVLFLDADDYFAENLVEKFYQKATLTKAEIVICDAYAYSEKNKKLSPLNAIEKNYIPDQEVFSCEDISPYIFNFTIGWAWDKFFKTSFVRKNGVKFQELRTQNDIYFTLMNIAQASAITILDEKLITHRINIPTSLESTRHKSYDNFIFAVYAMYDTLIKLELFEKFEQSFLNRVLNMSLWQINTLKMPESFYCYKKVKKELFPFFLLYSKPHGYFYREDDYAGLLRIQKRFAPEFYVTNRKLKKLFRDPYAFYADAKPPMCLMKKFFANHPK